MLIGEVSERTGISTRMLRHYDRIGVVRPSERTSAGYRRYAEADLQRLLHVEALRSLGLSLQEAAATLATPGFDPGVTLDALTVRTRARLVHEQELLKRLDLIVAGRPAAWRDVLATIGLIRGLQATEPARRQRHALSVENGAAGLTRLLAEALLAEDEPNVAGALQWALARSGESPVPILAAALGDADTQRRHRALAVLERLGTDASDTALAVHADATDPLVARRATLARGRRGDPQAVPGLVAMVAAGLDDVAAADVLAAVATRLQPDEVVALTIAAELEDGTPERRQRLVAALADVPGPRTQTLLRELQHDDDPVVAATARLLRERARQR